MEQGVVGGYRRVRRHGTRREREQRVRRAKRMHVKVVAPRRTWPDSSSEEAPMGFYVAKNSKEGSARWDYRCYNPLTGQAGCPLAKLAAQVKDLRAAAARLGSLVLLTCQYSCYYYLHANFR